MFSCNWESILSSPAGRTMIGSPRLRGTWCQPSMMHSPVSISDVISRSLVNPSVR